MQDLCSEIRLQPPASSHRFLNLTIHTVGNHPPGRPVSKCVITGPNLQRKSLEYAHIDCQDGAATPRTSRASAYKRKDEDPRGAADSDSEADAEPALNACKTFLTGNIKEVRTDASLIDWFNRAK